MATVHPVGRQFPRPGYNLFGADLLGLLNTISTSTEPDLNVRVIYYYKCVKRVCILMIIVCDVPAD